MLCSSSLEESGLGLLARFAASAIPSPVTPTPLSIIQLEAKQKARKKEARQSLLGNLTLGVVGWMDECYSHGLGVTAILGY